MAFTDRSPMSEHPQLDSTAAKEVIASVASLAKKEGIMVLASIHQPSFATLNEFTSLVLLSQGSLCYMGKVGDLEPFLLEIGVGSAPFVSVAFPRAHRSLSLMPLVIRIGTSNRHCNAVAQH
jgi:ABC-type multidrug transport system ATPase subunit